MSDGRLCGVSGNSNIGNKSWVAYHFEKEDPDKMTPHDLASSLPEFHE